MPRRTSRSPARFRSGQPEAGDRLTSQGGRLNERSEPWADDSRPWAAPGESILVERHEPWELATHGARAGLLAGVVLGLVEVIVNILLRGDPWLPLDFAAALLIGPAALGPGFPVVAAAALGTVMHLLLSVVFGVVFLAGLALTFQLSARPRLMLLYGALFGLTVWEVNFLAVLPLIAPRLVGQLGLTSQLWMGIAWYCFIYGPILAGYVVRVRPGVVDRWWQPERGAPRS